MVHRHRGKAERPFTAWLAWAGRLLQGQLVAAWRCAQLMHGEEEPLWTSHTTALPWVRDVLLPKFSYVGHNRTSENISNRFNSCGFFSASPPLLGLCCVRFFRRRWFQFHYIGNQMLTLHCRDAIACNTLAEDPLPESLVTITRRCPSLPAARCDPLRLRFRHVAVWGDINCC